MPGSLSSPTLFFSYARDNTAYEPDRHDMKKFRDDLVNSVALRMAISADGLCFFDESSIETGAIWSANLEHALKVSKVAVTLYSPSYFAREWCGKEFQVFLNRAAAVRSRVPGQTGIVPVLWMRTTDAPSCAEKLQHGSDAYPPEYAQMGLRQLMQLKVFSDQYRISLEATADSVVSAARAHPLRELDTLDIDGTASAWDLSVAAEPESHKQGSISKTCFVFVSREGWDWQPYKQKKIGAIAQEISGELALRYEEIVCDDELPKKLKETQSARVPTILFGDPDSFRIGAYEQALREYDSLYLLNCGALVPWSEDSKLQGDSDDEWRYLKRAVCQQKTKLPPPNHEWRSIFSQDDLKLKTRTVIEDIRLRLLQQVLSDAPSTEKVNGESRSPSVVVRKAEDVNLAVSAASKGIRTESAPQIEGPAK